ncbi:MAG: ATP-binding cassette domain-containing protein [Candidatus Microbacterium colombiense]|nr:MAG: ATP-binding cassette domain-containing protein [Microbacterium sp.]
MPDGQVLEFTHVTKRFNEVTAVSDLSARVEPGAVTAFLGPNGAGKTTTLRILLGQVRATSGTATIGGTSYAELRQPLRTIGSVLEETVYRPRRTASRQLTIAAKANGIPLARVGEVLGLVGLAGEEDSRIGGFSLGMRQRLSVAHALLGDPGALVFDEPANGLDPEGIRWMRLLMRRLADEGRTVLVSSHVLSEVEQVADNVLVLSKGQLVLSSGIEQLADPNAGSVVVDAADRAALTTALSTAGFDVEVLRSGLTVRGGDAGTVGAVAAAAGIALSTLVQRGPTLEDVFIELVRGGKLEPRASAAASQLVAPPTPTAQEPAEAEQQEQAETTAITIAADDAEVAEVAAVAAAVADTAPSDPVAAAAIAADIDASVHDAIDHDVTEAEIENTGMDAAVAVDESAEADKSVAESAPAEEAAETEPEAEVEEPSVEDAEDAPVAPSFDQILFGTAAPVTAETSTPAFALPSDGQTHDVEQIFADAGASESESNAEESAAEAAPADTADDANSDDANSDDQIDGEPSGIEIFDDLGGAGESASDESDDAEATDDPRSAAVSSMLAAAARAYYEDEPKDYPLGDAETSDDASPETQWSVASTGVIDTVPATGSEEPGAPDVSSDESHRSGEHEHHEGEHHEHHEGEHRQD